MANIELETWDDGRLKINAQFAPLLRNQGWQTFAKIWAETADAAIAKKLRTDRVTLRFTLRENADTHVFYIKRHVRSSWKEYIKPLLRLTWPILGARNEWNAILHFHESNIPTMTPVAFGESGQNSFLITKGLENCVKLSLLDTSNFDGGVSASDLRRYLVCEVARIARIMHRAGFHHQDFYLGHLMLSQTELRTIYVIDLGRVARQTNLARRWVVKDLAQLDFSAAAKVTRAERLRFLREYLNRPLTPADRRLIKQILSKHDSIARHSRKNRL